MKYILPKGFIAVDGISLTVGEVGEDSFIVYLIPETLRVTTLGRQREGDAVNIEIEAQTQVLYFVWHIIATQSASRLQDLPFLCTPKSRQR